MPTFPEVSRHYKSALAREIAKSAKIAKIAGIEDSGRGKVFSPAEPKTFETQRKGGTEGRKAVDSAASAGIADRLGNRSGVRKDHT